MAKSNIIILLIIVILVLLIVFGIWSLGVFSNNNYKPNFPIENSTETLYVSSQSNGNATVSVDLNISKGHAPAVLI